MTAPRGFTVVTKASGDIATKICRVAKDGSLTWDACGTGKMFYLEPQTFEDIDDLASIFRQLVTRYSSYIIRATPIAGVDLSLPQRRLLNDHHDGGKKALEPFARSWISFDFDGVKVPAPLGRPERFADGGHWLRDNLLPPAFHGVKGLFSTTSRSGLVADDIWRGRGTFVLSHSIDDDILEKYTEGLAAKLQVELDESVCRSTQPNYTARCKFIPPASDPFRPDEMVQIIPGKNGDIVPVNREALARQYEGARVEALAAVDRAYRAGGGGFAGYVAAVGSDGRFCKHLTAAIGSAAAMGMPVDEVIRVLLERLSQTADPARIRQYDAAWIRQAHKNFSLGSNAADAKHRAAVEELAALFRTIICGDDECLT